MASVVVSETPDGPVETPMDELPDENLRVWAAMGNEEARAILRDRAKASGRDRA